MEVSKTLQIIPRKVTWHTHRSYREEETYIYSKLLCLQYTVALCLQCMYMSWSR